MDSRVSLFSNFQHFQNPNRELNRILIIMGLLLPLPTEEYPCQFQG